jgi:hypothetical protein
MSYQPMDKNGRGAWWLDQKSEDGPFKYSYCHDHLGDACEQLDKLQDEYHILQDRYEEAVKMINSIKHHWACIPNPDCTLLNMREDMERIIAKHDEREGGKC